MTDGRTDNGRRPKYIMPLPLIVGKEVIIKKLPNANLFLLHYLFFLFFSLKHSFTKSDSTKLASSGLRAALSIYAINLASYSRKRIVHISCKP